MLQRQFGIARCGYVVNENWLNAEKSEIIKRRE
jgi:hypothetical protein